MCFLGHAEHFAHGAGCWSCAVHSTGDITFLNYAVLFAELFEVWVLQRLSCGHTVVMVVDQEFLDDVAGLWVLWNKLLEASTFLLWEVEFHMACYFLKLVKQLFVRRTNDIMNFMNLVKLIGTRKERS